MPDHDFKSPRLFVEPELAEAVAVEASAEQLNYLVNVMRLGDSGRVLLFNGRDGEWRARLHRETKKRLLLVPERQLRDQTPQGSLHYLFAPLKSARLDYMVQKAVEMGAGVLQPVMMQHVQAPKLNLARMRANAVEAAEQCGIIALPDCREMIRLADLLENFDPARRLVFCDERADSASTIEILRAERTRPVSLLIGPEGGFSADERAMLHACDFVTPISLGPRILRADTAAVAALAVVQAAVGDWQGDG